MLAGYQGGLVLTFFRRGGGLLLRSTQLASMDNDSCWSGAASYILVCELQELVLLFFPGLLPAACALRPLL